MFLQCVFVGKAQEAYSSLSVEESLDYEQVGLFSERTNWFLCLPPKTLQLSKN